LKKILTLAIGVLLCSVSTVAQNNKGPALTIEKNRLVASNFSRGSIVIVFSVASEGEGYYSTTRPRVMRLPDADNDGTIVFNHPDPFPLRSVWIAVDERNGDFALASPEGYTPVVARAPSLRKHDAVVDEIDWPSHAAYLLYIHPGKGAWTGFSSDATPASHNPGDYLSSLTLTQLHPLLKGNTDKPSQITPGGTLFLVDAYDLRMSAVKVDGAMIGGAK